MDAFYSSALLVGAITQSKGVSYYFILPEQCTLCPVHTVHRSEGESEGRADLLLPARDKERVHGMLKGRGC